jgi:hypothetical protein
MITLPRVIPATSGGFGSHRKRCSPHQAVAVITITVLLIILVDGVAADPLADRYARALARSAGGHPGAEVARHTGT